MMLHHFLYFVWWFQQKNLHRKTYRNYRHSVKFVVSTVLKTSKPNKDSVDLQRTKTSRETVGTTRLLLSYVESFRPISTDTCARWVRTVLSLSGMDVSIFKAQSFRSGSWSKGTSLGISIDLTLKNADWSNENTFTRFHRRDVLPV